MKPFSCYIRNQYFELYMYLHIINKIILWWLLGKTCVTENFVLTLHVS